MNSWSGIGNIGNEPILRSTSSGRSVLNFSIAVDRTIRVETPEGTVSQRSPDWIPIVVFGDAAEHHAKYLQKGTKVAVTGSLRPRSYTDTVGVTHYTFEIQAESIDWLANVRSPQRIQVAVEASPG